MRRARSETGQVRPTGFSGRPPCYDRSVTGGEAGTGRDALAQRLLFVVLAIAIPVALASAPDIFNDGDVSWHLAAGQWILQHGTVPRTDPFSFTAAGRPWVPLEWLAEILFAAAHRAAGYAGLSAVVAAALIALHATVFLHLRRRTALLAIAAALLLMDMALAPFLLARPHVLVWPLLAAWTALLARASETGRPPPYWAALLLVAWTNLHGSFPLAAVIAAPLAFDALARARWRTLRSWLAFAGVSLVAILLNLFGLEGLLHPFSITRLESIHFVQEWLPSTPGRTPLFYAVLLAGLGALLWSGARVPAGRLALLLVLLLLAFSQQRHQSWFVIVAALLIPPLFKTRPEPARKLAPLALAVIPLALLARAVLPMTPEENSANPRRLLAAIPPELRDRPVFNEYTFGGPLILAGIKPYIDGRNDLYGDAFNRDYFEIAGGDFARFERAAERHDIRWTLLPSGDSRLVAELERSGRWRRIHSDRVGVIHVRVDGQRP